MEASSSEAWGLEDNIFIRGPRGTVPLLALWSLLAAIGCSLVVRDALPDDVRLAGYIQSLEFDSTIGYLSFILCSIWSGAVGREFAAAVLTWHKARRLKKRDTKRARRVGSEEMLRTQDVTLMSKCPTWRCQSTDASS